MIVGAVGATLWQGVFLSFADFADDLGFGTYAAVQPLEGPAGAQHPWTNDGVLVGRGFQITKECEYPEVLIRWIDYFYSEEGCMWQMRGIEDVHYEWVDKPAINGNIPSYTRIQDAIQAPVSTFILNQGPMFFTNELRYSETGVEGTAGLQLYVDGELYKPFVDFDRNYMPFTEWLSEEDTRALSLIEKPVEDYRKEAEAKFIIGDMNFDADWDTYISTLESMGLDQLLELKQSMFDAAN